MYIGFSSAELSSAAISDYLTRVVQPLLATVDGVASADILGGQTFAMRLWLDPARMAARGISADDVAARDPRQQLPVGARPGERLLHGHQHRRPIPGSTDIDQFKRMVVKADGRRGGAAARTSPPSSSARRAGIRASR